MLGIRLFATGWALLEHAFLIEFDISLPLGGTVMKRLPAVIAEHLLPPQLVESLERLHTHYKYIDAQIAEIDKKLVR
ncbi:protein of unknown function (plasmid) [Cupriavidus taiwanensis]|uniref:Uncharacterized protein n=1 Tax=Cupriavidus taiwanensis TaxID=164546 RepID=A0A375IUF7_9BURK|nr:hypothetical protein CT19425_U610028 [Cupriavidus taiwanensis]SPK77751.1 protein of unknown function [Cupriavidus taiwanensis]